MYAVGMLGSYLTQGVYAVAGPFQPFGGAVDIIVVQQEDGTFKSSPWYVKFGDFQGVLKRQEKIVDISVNDVPADFHMILDSKGEAYFEKEVEPDEGTCSVLPDSSSSSGCNKQEGEVESVVGTDARVDAHLPKQEAQFSHASASLPDRNGMAGIAEVKNALQGELLTTRQEQGSGLYDELNLDGRGASLLSSEKIETYTGEIGLEAACTEIDSNCVEMLRTQKDCWEAEEQASNGDGSHLGWGNVRVFSCNELNLASREVSVLSSKTEAFNREFCLEAACTESDSNCMEVSRMQKECWEAKEQANSADGSKRGRENVRVSSSMNGQMRFEPLNAHSREFCREATVPEDDVNPLDLRRTINPSFEGREGVSLASQDSVKPDRDNGVDTVVKVDGMLHNTAFIAKEESSLQEALTVLDVATDSALCVKDNPLLGEMWTDHTVEGFEDDQNYENSSNSDVNVDEDEVLASFERVTVEREGEELIFSSNDSMNGDEPCDYGMNEDSLSWDFESSVNKGSDVDVFPLSKNSAILREEDPGNATADLEKEKISDSNSTGDAGSPATFAAVSSPSKWRLWPFFLRWSRIEKASSLSNQALLAAATVAIRTPFTDGLLQKDGYLKWQQKTKVRTYVPTSVQLASLKLNDGPNKVTFTFSSVIGKTQVDARIYLWKWNTRIVISDVDGTITKSDVLGQVMPLVGRDWSQYGVTRLFSAIKDNGYEVLFLSARAISQAYLTRRFLLNLKQDGEALPEGPVFISPDGLIPSLYREVIRRAPHEFKISCLEGIRELFSTDVNPFYAGFGNRETDEISYLKVGIPKGKIFIINPKGEVVVNHRVDCKSYTSLYALVDEMFPPMSSHEQEEFNEWNYWRVPLPDIEDELTAKSSKTVKKAGSFKK